MGVACSACPNDGERLVRHLPCTWQRRRPETDNSAYAPFVAIYAFPLAPGSRAPPTYTSLKWQCSAGRHIIFFVPLLYAGAELAAADRLAAKALKVRTWLELGIMGGVPL